MAVGPSNWLIDSMWDAALCGIPFVVNQVYVQFHSADPGSGGTANAVAVDRQPTPFERDVDGHWRTSGAPWQAAIINVADVIITHISLHTDFTAGNWMGNMIANQPIPVVEGDLLINTDGIQWTVTDWIS